MNEIFQIIKAGDVWAADVCCRRPLLLSLLTAWAVFKAGGHEGGGYSDVTRNFTLGGLKPNRTNSFLPLPFRSPFPPFPLPFLLASFPSHPLEVGPLKRLGVWGAL